MLDYEWGMLNGTGAVDVDDSASQPDQTRSIFDHYSFEAANSHYLNNNNHNNPHHEHNNNDFIHHTHNAHHVHNAHNAHNPHHQQQHYLDGNAAQGHPHFGSLYDPRGYAGDCPYSPPLLSLEPESSISTGYLLMPKAEPAGCAIDFANNRIGLNLGGRTYFSSAEDDFVNRLYRRSRPLDAALLTSPRCQAEGCNADLTNAKHYHRRHKVCEFHSKASTVITAGLTQRFCQQCSRFHLLSEFDNGKRSCRKRLADHNRRRRKSSQNQDHSKSHVTVSSTQSSSSEIISRYQSDSRV